MIEEFKTIYKCLYIKNTFVIISNHI